MISLTELYGLFLKSSGIATDSRNIAHGSLFFALKGDQFDGNLFALDAIRNGAAFSVTDNPDIQQHEQILLVTDVLDTLQELALLHRKNIRAKIIAITGSNGKTTTKELIGKVLGSFYNTLVTKGNLNNHIGVPLTLLSIREDIDFAVVEMGANHPGEIDALCRIARPDYGLITNIGKAHLEGFGSFEGVIRTKSELYNYLKENSGLVFYNSDNELLSNLSIEIKRKSYGMNQDAERRGEILSNDPFLSLKWEEAPQSGIVDSALYGEYNFENIMAAICIGLYFGVRADQIKNAIASYIPENNRSQIIQTEKNVIISDAYNANPSSMKAALINFSKMKSPAKMLILGDMMELGDYSLEEHVKIVNYIRELGFEKVLLIGDWFYKAAENGKEICFNSTNAAEAWLSRQLIANRTILLKGSRKMQLETLRKYL